MPLSVSNTYLFDMPVDEIINSAGRRAFGEKFQGVETKQARSMLNLLFIDLQNRKLPLCTVKEHTLTLVAGQANYDLPDSVLAVLELSWRDANSQDIPLGQISFLEYSRLYDKATSGMPTQYTIQNERSNLNLKLWQVPSAPYATTLCYASIDKIDDVNASHQLVNLSNRYLPAVIAGLAYFMAMDKGEIVTEEKLTRLYTQYIDFLTAAAEFDSETTDFRLVPAVPVPF
jgi:hypothetical protein